MIAALSILIALAVIEGVVLVGLVAESGKMARGLLALRGEAQGIRSEVRTDLDRVLRAATKLLERVELLATAEERDPGPLSQRPQALRGVTSAAEGQRDTHPSASEPWGEPDERDAAAELPTLPRAHEPEAQAFHYVERGTGKTRCGIELGLAAIGLTGIAGELRWTTVEAAATCKDCGPPPRALDAAPAPAVDEEADTRTWTARGQRGAA